MSGAKKRKQSLMTKKIERHIKKQQKAVTGLEGTAFGLMLKDSLEKLRLYFHGRVLDAGCGDGYGMKIIASFGCKVEGLDLLPGQVKLASRYGKVTQAPLEEMPFADKEFDVVFCSHTLEHTFDFPKAIKELERIAKRLIIIVPMQGEKNDVPSHTHPFCEASELTDYLTGEIVCQEFLPTSSYPDGAWVMQMGEQLIVVENL